MSDVVWAAVIAGGVGLAGNVVTYLATRTQARSQARTEGKRIEADADRLRDEHREAERQRRLNTYRELLSAAYEFDIAAGSSMDEAGTAELTERLKRILVLASEVELFGSSGAAERSRALRTYIGTIFTWTDEASFGDDPIRGWQRAWDERRNGFLDAEKKMRAAMREDVTRGLLPDAD